MLCCREKLERNEHRAASSIAEEILRAFEEQPEFGRTVQASLRGLRWDIFRLTFLFGLGEQDWGGLSLRTLIWLAEGWPALKGSLFGFVEHFRERPLGGPESSTGAWITIDCSLFQCAGF